MVYEVSVNGKPHRLELDRAEGRWHCTLDSKPVTIDAVLTRPDVLSVLIGGKAFEIKRERTPADLHLWVGSARFEVVAGAPARTIHDEKSRRHRPMRCGRRRPATKRGEKKTTSGNAVFWCGPLESTECCEHFLDRLHLIPGGR